MYSSIIVVYHELTTLRQVYFARAATAALAKLTRLSNVNSWYITPKHCWTPNCVAQIHRQWNPFCAALYWSRNAHIWRLSGQQPECQEMRSTLVETHLIQCFGPKKKKFSSILVPIFLGHYMNFWLNILPYLMKSDILVAMVQFTWFSWCIIPENM